MARPSATGAPGPACGHPPERQQSAFIGSPAPKRPPVEDPPIDPTAIRRARVRFLVLLGVLLFVSIFLALSIWEKIQTAFGI
jgi:hypothetical protein